MTTIMKINEAYTVARFFFELRHQIDVAWAEQRDEDAKAMARLSGQLKMRIFGFARSPLDNPEHEVAA